MIRVAGGFLREEKRGGAPDQRSYHERREGQKLAINGTGVNGLQSLSFGYDSTAQPILPLGVDRVLYAPGSLRQPLFRPIVS